MAKFLSTRATSAKIEEILSGAKRYVVLVSPFIRLSTSIRQLIIETTERKIQTVIIYGKDEAQPLIDDQLKKIPNLELYFVKNLHAKCYFNDEQMVLSSMNLYEFSEVNNWEMSVLVDKVQDAEMYSSVVNEVKRILKSVGKVFTIGFYDTNTPTNVTSSENSISVPEYMQDLRKKLLHIFKSLAADGGVCIRCGDKIPVDYEKPYCKNCYRSWLRFENYDYKEKRCHLCGKSAETTIEYPLCLQCYEKIMNKVNKE